MHPPYTPRTPPVHTRSHIGTVRRAGLEANERSVRGVVRRAAGAARAADLGTVPRTVPPLRDRPSAPVHTRSHIGTVRRAGLEANERSVRGVVRRAARAARAADLGTVPRTVPPLRDRSFAPVHTRGHIGTVRCAGLESNERSVRGVVRRAARAARAADLGTVPRTVPPLRDRSFAPVHTRGHIGTVRCAGLASNERSVRGVVRRAARAACAADLGPVPRTVPSRRPIGAPTSILARLWRDGDRSFAPVHTRGHIGTVRCARVAMRRRSVPGA